MLKPDTLPRLNIVIALFVAGLCFSAIAYLFWLENYKYSIPTPVPADYKHVANGDNVSFVKPLDQFLGKSVFLHFYNPECPCSRFNSKYLKTLIQSYKDDTPIVIVVQSESDRVSASDEFEGVEFYIDSNLSLAKSCGVYSTPQAVIVDKEGKLFYRGNYNESRFCTARATNFAELALIAMLNNQPSPTFDIRATQSYGCELPQANPYEIKFQ